MLAPLVGGGRHQPFSTTHQDLPHREKWLPIMTSSYEVSQVTKRIKFTIYLADFHDSRFVNMHNRVHAGVPQETL